MSEPAPVSPRRTRSKTTALGVAPTCHSLPRPTRRGPVRRIRQWRPHFWYTFEEEDNDARYTFNEFVEANATGEKEEMVNLEDVPDLDLGEAMFEDEDLQTHHTITNKLGYTNIMAVVAPGAEEGKKRKRKGVGRGSLKRRRAFKWGGGTKRGPGGRFVRSGMEDDPIVLE